MLNSNTCMIIMDETPCSSLPSNNLQEPNHAQHPHDHDDGAIVVVAKCPIPGKSKTRLIPLLGPEGSARLARAMLSDVLVSLVQCRPLDPVKIILYYAPDKTIMVELLKELKIDEQRVHLLPMLKDNDLTKSDLGRQLTNALQEARNLTKGNVMFLGMDAPILPLEEIPLALSLQTEATLCPALDGGYGMLSVPTQCPDSIFSNVLWSNSLTGLAQLKALTDAHIPVRLGRIMMDIDEEASVRQLVRYATLGESMDLAILQTTSSKTPAVDSDYRYTKQALRDLKLL
jgi:glycosyltransferase A (GT-A) superfamily protein (DUF2064 family)